MRVILIEEDRFAEIRDLIKAHCTDPNVNAFLLRDAEELGIPKEKIVPLLESMWRTFNYQFVRWAQSHGASCVSR